MSDSNDRESLKATQLKRSKMKKKKSREAVAEVEPDVESEVNKETTPYESVDVEVVASPEASPESKPSTSKPKKPQTPGVIYLSSIPEGMQYNDVYKVFSELGEVGRISLQIGGPQPHHPKLKRYSEGWIEFLDKRKAKRCVLLLNNQLVGGRKKSKWYDSIWHMRYLPKFQWIHLTERLAYEQASARQRMTTEISQARQEAHHFAEQIEWKQKEVKMASKHADWKSNKRPYDYIQKSTDDEIRQRKAGTERVKKQAKARSNVLGSLFGQSTSADS